MNKLKIGAVNYQELPSPIQVQTWIDCMRYKCSDPETKELVSGPAIKKILNTFGSIKNLAEYMKVHGLE
jgi:hypothetical protein